MGSRGRSIFRYALIGLICATLLFIFLNSMMPPAVSSEESGAVADWLAVIFPPDTGFGAFVAAYVRKIAHFLEYGVLGAEISLYVLLFMKDMKKWLPASLAFGFVTAFLDETIQIFSGRGPAIADVWLDFAGFISLSAALHLVFFIKNRFLRKSKEKK